MIEDTGGSQHIAGHNGSTCDAFFRPSLTIELHTSHFPYDEGYLAGPGYYRIPSLRVFIHETVHFWQTLSQGYMTNLAQEEWLALSNFEATGSSANYGSLQTAYTTKDETVGFSTADIVECLARLWDIMILGPDRLEEWHTGKHSHRTTFTIERQDDPKKPVQPMTNQRFDHLMQMEDTYAEPYRLMLRQHGTKSSVILFPLVAHFSLQSPKPVQTFAVAVEAVASAGAIQFNTDIHEGWRQFYAPLRKVCNQASLMITGSLLTSGFDVMRRGDLGHHPLFRHFLGMYDGAAPYTQAPLDFFFAVLGDPETRGFLRGFFVPPLVLFHDGQWVQRAPILERDSFDDAIGLLDASSLADIARNINLRFRKMRRNQLLQSLLCKDKPA